MGGLGPTPSLPRGGFRAASRAWMGLAEITGAGFMSSQFELRTSLPTLLTFKNQSMFLNLFILISCDQFRNHKDGSKVRMKPD